MKNKNRKIILGSVIFLIIGFFILQQNNIIFGKNTNEPGSNINFTTIKAEKGDIKNSIDVVGEAELVDEQSLSFNKTGTITKIYFSAGDNVKKGDIIAQLDDSDGYDAIEEAKLNLENAKINLQQLYEEADESKKLSAQNDIDNTQNSIEITKKEIENLQTSQKNDLEKQSKDITNLQKELENLNSSLQVEENELETLKKEKENNLSDTQTNINTTVKTLESSLSSEVTNIDGIIEAVDYILGVTEKNKEENDNFQDELGAKNPSDKTSAENSLKVSIELFDNIKTRTNNYTSSDTEELKNIYSDLLELYKKLEETTDNTYKTLENSVEGGDFTESVIESKKSSIANYRSNAQNKITNITSSIKTLDTLTDLDLLGESNNNSILSKQESIKSTKLQIEKKKLEIDTAEKKYALTVSEYETSLKSKEQNLEKLQKTLEVNKATLEEVLEGPTDENVAKAKNSISQAEIKLSTAYENLDDYKLEAPFDGVIRTIDYMVGDKINNDTDKSVYIENPNLLEISVMLDQIDIVNVEKGDEAIITFDAYTTTPANAKINSIDTTPVQNSGVVSYEVKLVLDDDNFDKKILSGMTSDVEIITENKKDVILIKSSAITERDNKKFVMINKDGKPNKAEVKTGLTSDGQTEIISGLSEGDEVLITEFKANSNLNKIENKGLLFGGGNRRGGGMGGPPM
ncbi:MAG: efflux RND transporter periplasmic adaptor subunit [Candidatus Gracilibacteria bacterium]|nr:efflux RND transporter periplasmic adaptor subunit [Candidatus Gracilibacteria bacterium]